MARDEGPSAGQRTTFLNSYIDPPSVIKIDNKQQKVCTIRSVAVICNLEVA